MVGDLLAIASALAPVFGLLAVGWALRRRQVLSEAGAADLNRLLYAVLLPVQLAVVVGGTDLRRDFEPLALAAAAAAFALGMAGAWLATPGLDPPRRGSALSGVARANGAFVGLPVVLLVAPTLPPEAADRLKAAYTVLLAVMVPVFNVGAVLGFRLPHHGLTGAGLRDALGEIPRNPIIIGCTAGIALSLLAPGFIRPDAAGVRNPLAEGLHLLSLAAIPLALIATGASLDLALMRRSPRLLAWVGLGKLALVPAACWLLCRLMGVDGAATTAAVVLMACPTAVASVPMARLLGGDAELSAAITVATTLAAPATLGLWLLVLR